MSDRRSIPDQPETKAHRVYATLNRRAEEAGGTAALAQSLGPFAGEDKVTAHPAVTVAIINYNGRRFLDELLISLRDQTLAPNETVLIDNNSSDDSVAYVRNNYHWVRTIPESDNLGFAKAGNLALSSCDSEFVALLNTDIKLDPAWLESLVAPAARDASIAAVASKLRLYADPSRLNGVGGAMNYLGYTWDRGMFEVDAGQLDQPAEVLFASAGAALFRRSTFLTAGGFDERFFMYHEDVDLCWRFWLLGHRVLTAPRAVALHHFGGSTSQAKGFDWRELIGERNNIRALIKNYEAANVRRALLHLLRLRQPAARKAAQLRNFAWNMRHLPDTLRHRKRIQQQRVRTDAEITRLIVQSPNVPIRL
ncbi:MAG: glycosyltransferase family 2 protein [Acidobacteria bacterium]|nr:MAG: glycosyltransferase family 2 protein [Acidobacteriota bacterium]